MTTERSVELPWLYAQDIQFPALDVGCHESVYLRHYDDALTPLDGLDIRQQTRGGLREFYLGDIRTWPSPHQYSTVIALSTIEHIGLASSDYGTLDDDPDGDRQAVLGCIRILKPGGTLLLTVPFGRTAEHRGWYRIYDQASLEALLDGLTVRTLQIHFNPEWAVGGVALVRAITPCD